MASLAIGGIAVGLPAFTPTEIVPFLACRRVEKRYVIFFDAPLIDNPFFMSLKANFKVSLDYFLILLFFFMYFLAILMSVTY